MFSLIFLNKNTKPIKKKTYNTFVIPRAPMFSLNDVVPLPLPQAPANKQPIPSIPIPRLMASFGGDGAPHMRAHA